MAIRKNLVLGLTLGIGLLFSGSIEATAEVSERFNIDVSSEPNKISLDWNDIGAKYEIIQDGELVWEGSESEYTAINLESEYRYNYNLVAYDNENNVVEESAIRATTTKDEVAKKALKSSRNEEPNPMSEVFVNSIILGDEVTISWEGSVPDDDGIYEVYRDGTYIGTTNKNEYKDNNIEKNKEYNYEIIGKIKFTEEEIKSLKKAYKEKNLDFNVSEEDLYHTNTINRLIKTNDFKVQPLAAVAPTSYTMRYTTFIPDEYVPNPFTGGGFTGLTYFGGDNRKYSVNSNKFRTRSDVKIIWNGSTPTVNLDKKVHSTFLYDYSYRPIWVGTAPDTGIKLSNVVANSTRVSYQIKHDVGIPFGDAMSPDITYSYTATVFKNSSYNVAGQHDQAPSHEMYIFIPNSDISNRLHAFANKGFKYLWPHEPNHRFNASY